MNVFDKSKHFFDALNQDSQSIFTTAASFPNKPLVVDVLSQDDGIRYKGTFDSLSRQNRVTLFQALIKPDEFEFPRMVELQRDKVHVNRVFIVI